MSNKVKVPGGAFYAGDGLTVDPVTRTVSAGGGAGGSVPKPLTYDYMPEGYPSREMQITTLMEEQELAFTVSDGLYIAPITNALEIVAGQTYTVNWDGTEYECVCSAAQSSLVLGNLSIMEAGADTGEPFIYANMGSVFATLDTSASHTISVKRIEETVTPMAEEFLPENLATTSDVEVTQSIADAAEVAADNAQRTADNAQRTAYNAQRTADNAQRTADNAKATADAALPKSGGEMSGVIKSSSNIEFPRKYSSNSSPINGLEIRSNIDSKVLTNWIRSYGVDSSLSRRIETIVTYLDGIIIYTPNTTTNVNTITIAAEGVRLDFLSSNGKKPITISAKDIILQSSTAGSTKKFRITVDDSGKISATEVTA